MPALHAVVKPSKWEAALTKLAVLVSILLIVGGAIGMIFVQEELRKSQDLRQQASVAQGQVEVTTSAQDFVIDEENLITFSVNTHGVQTDGIQLTFNVVTGALHYNPIFTLKPGVPLQIAYSEIEVTADGFLVSVIAIPSTIGQSFSTNTSTPFAQLSVIPVRSGSIVLNFDVENSISTVHGTNPPTDELTHIPTATYQVASVEASTSPSPSASPSTSPSASPSVSPSPSPSPTPGVGGEEVSTCNESCAVNADCDLNLRCYSGQCRLVTNVSSTTCSAPADQGLSFACNEYCADTRECADGLICHENKCRNPENMENTRCTALSVAQRSSLIRSCNESCTSNAQCDVNLRCYEGACRLATNPGSFSCKPATAKTVSESVYGGTKGGDLMGQESTKSAKPIGSLDTSKSTKTATASTTKPVAEEKTALDSVKNYFLANPQLPMMVIGVGLGLIVLLILVSVLKSLTKRRPPTPPTGDMRAGQTSPSRPVSGYEQNLQTKINALKDQRSEAGVAKTSLPTPPAPTPIAATPAQSMVAAPEEKSFLPPSAMRDMTNSGNSTEVFSSTPTAPISAVPTPEPVASLPIATATPASSEPQSMLERLKSRNVSPPAV